MKKIYVTVAEFLENGGELEVGRNIYKISGELDGGYIPFIDKRVKKKILVNAHDGVLERSTNFRYVQIDCTPIYK